MAILGACNFDKAIDVQLPPHESQLAVECYLVAGEQTKLLLTETRNYFEEPRQPFINNATITYSINGQQAIMPFEPVIDTTFKKVYNYSLPLVVAADTSQQFNLQIQDTAGRTVYATTRMMPQAQIDTVYWRFRGGDSLAYIVVLFKRPVDPGVHYYRVLLNRNNQREGAVRDYVADDALFGGMQLPVVSDYRFAKGDTVYVRAIRIDKAYYDFLQTAASSQRLAGNPFAQPTPVRSNINGGFGIFTAFNPVVKKIAIK